jgi:hypothetical protein
VTKSRVSLLFHVAMLAFAADRTACYFALGLSSAQYTERAFVGVRRLGSGLHFTMFSLIVFWWAAAFSRAFRRGRSSFLPTLVAVLIGLNVLVYALAMAFVGVWWATRDDRWYNASVWFLIATSAVAEVLVLLIALVVYCR